MHRQRENRPAVRLAHREIAGLVAEAGSGLLKVQRNRIMHLRPDAVFDEIDRVLRPGGRLQIADVVVHTEVSEDARKRIDLWTG